MGIERGCHRQTEINVTTTKQTVTLKTLPYHDIFVDPNIVVIHNFSNDYTIYFSTKSNVSSSNYELTIPPQTSGKTVRLGSIKTFYIVGSGEILDTIIEYAYDDAPTPTDLDGSQATYMINPTITLGALPSGTNTIGSVKITDGTETASVDANNNLMVAIDDGKITTLGNRNDNRSSATDTTAITAMQILKQLSYLLQNQLTNKIVDTGGTNEMVVESDGSINVNVDGGTINVTATAVQIEDASSHALNINSDGSADVNILNAIPAGDNNIGNVDIVTLPSLPAGTNNIGDVDVLTVASGQNLKPGTTPAIYNVTCTTAGGEYSQALTSGTKMFQIGLQSKDDTVTWKLKFGASGTERTFIGSESPSFDNLLLTSKTLYFETDKDGEVMEIVEVS